MSLDNRYIVPYPDGNSTSSTTINGVYFNKTALNTFGYVLYSNKTLSNDSNCFLVFDQFKPIMLDNGTWVNGTTCYVPFYHIRTRGIWSIIFGTLFGLTIVFTMVNLRKHGKVYIREQKRFRVVGRRWQYYWMLFVAACGMISTLTGVDIDRNYLQDLPIILQSFFFTLMMPATLAMVWETTRHWGSWQERQIYDADPFLVSQHDHAAKTRFWLPLVFYTFAFLSFFMLIPRPWAAISQQNSEWQKANVARPCATSGRDKAGSIIAIFAFGITLFSLWHSLKYYQTKGWLKGPWKVVAVITLLAIRLGYGIASSWNWNLSISQVGVTMAWPFGLGYLPILLIILVLEIAGFAEENEDRVLLRQRAARGSVNDAELQITQKPSWWSKAPQKKYMTDERRLRELTLEFEHEAGIDQIYELDRVDHAPPRANQDGPFRDDLASQDQLHDKVNGKHHNENCGKDWKSTEHNPQARTKIRSMLNVS